MNTFNRINTNCTTRFLLPIVFSSLTYDELEINGFRQSFVGMLDNRLYDDDILLIFDRIANEERLKEVFGNMKVEFDLDLDKCDERIIVVIVKDRQNYIGEDIYSNFLAGKYSKFDNHTKRTIENFWGEDSKSVLHMILYKDPKFMDLVRQATRESFVSLLIPDEKDLEEYWPKPDFIEDELFFSADFYQSQISD